MATNSAWFGGYDNGVDEIFQSVNFGSLAGTATLTFKLGIDPVDVEGFDFFEVRLGGTTIDLIDLGDDVSSNFIGPLPYSYDVSAWMGTGVQQLRFVATTDGSAPSSGLLDNVSIQTAPVPEPVTAMALAAGTGILALRRRRKS